MRKTSVGSSNIPQPANEPIDFILAKFPRIQRVFDIFVQLFEADAMRLLGAAIGGIDVRARENHHTANVKIAALSESTQLIAQQSDPAQEHFYVGLLHCPAIQRQFPSLINSDQSNPVFGLDREKTGGAKNDMLENYASGIQIMEDKKFIRESLQLSLDLSPANRTFAPVESFAFQRGDSSACVAAKPPQTNCNHQSSDRRAAGFATGEE